MVEAIGFLIGVVIGLGILGAGIFFVLRFVAWFRDVLR